MVEKQRSNKRVGSHSRRDGQKRAESQSQYHNQSKQKVNGVAN
jgi:hypothetical protein